jgi:hypothetical protein
MVNLLLVCGLHVLQEHVHLRVRAGQIAALPLNGRPQLTVEVFEPLLGLFLVFLKFLSLPPAKNCLAITYAYPASPHLSFTSSCAIATTSAMDLGAASTSTILGG